MIAIEFWRHGAAHKMYNICGYLGLSQGVNAALARVDILVKNHDRNILQWKAAIEV
jgi:hypothetical protein